MLTREKESELVSRCLQFALSDQSEPVDYSQYEVLRVVADLLLISHPSIGQTLHEKVRYLESEEGFTRGEDLASRLIESNRIPELSRFKQLLAAKIKEMS